MFDVYQQIPWSGKTARQVVDGDNEPNFTKLAQPIIMPRAFGEQAGTVASRLAGVALSIQRPVLRYDNQATLASRKLGSSETR